MKKLLIIIFVLLFSFTANAQILKIYGYDSYDESYTEYLGKLNASKYDSESIWNKYGEHGNVYNSECIWNKYGTYGSEYNISR